MLAAAVAGPWQLEERPFDLSALDPQPPAVTEPPPEQPEPTDVEPSPEPQQDADLTWVTVLAVLLGLAAAAAAARWVWHRWRHRRRAAASPRAVEVADDLVPELGADPALPGLRDATSAAQRSLRDIADPGDAVVAAWVALEDAAATAGVPRAPAQTPTELTVTVLARTDADPDAVAELLALYHRARFSARPVGADEVDRAAACLERLAASWDALPAAHGGMP